MGFDLRQSGTSFFILQTALLSTSVDVVALPLEVRMLLWRPYLTVVRRFEASVENGVGLE